MASTYKLLDTFKLSEHVQNNFACDISEDDKVFVLTNLGVYVLILKPKLNSSFANLSCQKVFFKCSKYAICDNVDMDINTFLYELPKEIFYECVARVDLTANMQDATPAEPCVVSAAWSHPHPLTGTSSLIAVLTNLYSLEIYSETVDESNVTEYNNVLNISEEFIKLKKSEFVYSVKLPPFQKYNEFKKRIELITPTGFCWSHSFINASKSCAVLFVGHYYGFITVWRIFFNENGKEKSTYDFMGRFSTSLGEIVAMYWHQIDNYDGALCLGDSDGKISIVHVTSLDKNGCVVDSEVKFCQEKDHRVDKLTMLFYNDYTFLVAVKQCYLFIYGLNHNGNLIDFTVHSVDNLYITGIACTDNKIKVSTFNGAFIQLLVSVHYNKICVTQKQIPIKLDSVGYRTHGFVETKNNALTLFILHPFRLSNCVKGKQFINCLTFSNTELDLLKILLENDTGTIANHWDCLEALRLLCLKEQRFPWHGLDAQLDYESLSLDKLKTLRLISKLSETVFVAVKEIISYDIKPYILLHYMVDVKLIVHRLNDLFAKIKAGVKLNDFQMKSIDIQLFFLKEVVVGRVLAKAGVGQTFINEISHILAIGNEISFPDMDQCHFCGEKLIGITCIPPHADSRCCFSMCQIYLAPAFKCMLCDVVAHKEAVSDMTRVECPYCDIPMVKITTKQEIQDVINKSRDDFKVMSECCSDCITENLDANDIEDNDIDVLIISDDEDDKPEVSVKELYFKLATMDLGNKSNSAVIKENKE